MPRPKLPPKGLVPCTVKDATDHFLAAVKVKHGESGTTKAKRVIMRAFRDKLGDDRQMWTLTTGDFDDVLTWMIAGADEREAEQRRREGRRARTGRKTKESQAIAKATMKQFAEYSRRHNWLPLGITLLDEIFKLRKDEVVERPPFFKITLAQYREYLDLAETVHMRCRIAVALGLYLGRRVSEIRRMTWADVDFINGDVYYYNVKGGRHGKPMPMYPELRAELERWRDWVTAHYGDPQPDWWLVPSRALRITGANSRMNLKRDGRLYPLDMTCQSSTDTIGKDVRRMFAKVDIGPNEGTGTHTWRRSMATEIKRLFGIGVAQRALGHKTPQTTEGYTGTDDDYDKMHEVLRAGLSMMHDGPDPAPDNVIELRPHRREAS